MHMYNMIMSSLRALQSIFLMIIDKLEPNALKIARYYPQFHITFGF